MSLEFAEKFEVFVNVSENKNYSLLPGNKKIDVDYHWIPIIDENSYWGYEPFLESRRILDFYHDKETRIYLHCKNGINRSPCIAMAWLMFRGYNLDEAALCVAGGSVDRSNSHQRNFQGNVEKRLIPNSLLRSSLVS